MSYCHRMNRDCTCGRLSVYDQSGRTRELPSALHCLTDNEVQGAATLVMNEWRRRFPSGEVGPARLTA